MLFDSTADRVGIAERYPDCPMTWDNYHRCWEVLSDDRLLLLEPVTLKIMSNKPVYQPES